MQYGLIGEKLGHSFSKLVQERLLEDYVYELHPLSPNALDAFLKEKNFKGINVTIPYKQDVIAYLDEVDTHAKIIGAVNTIVNRNGKLYGYNTDYNGFAYMLRYHNIDVRNKKVIILGSGGASKAVYKVVKDMGADQIYITSRKKNETTLLLQEVYTHHNDAHILINTTPCGMYPNVDSTPIELSHFTQCLACIDVVYNPLHTTFLIQAKQRGIQVVGGLQMLVAQAKYALEHFKSIQIDDVQIDRIYQEIMLSQCNIITTNPQQVNDLCITYQKEYVDLKKQDKSILADGSKVAACSLQQLQDIDFINEVARNSIILQQENIEEVINKIKKWSK